MQLMTVLVHSYTDNYYPLLTKCDIAIKFRDKENLANAVKQLEILKGRKSVPRRTLSMYKAYLLALNGEKAKSLKLIERILNHIIIILSLTTNLYRHYISYTIFKSVCDNLFLS